MGSNNGRMLATLGGCAVVLTALTPMAARAAGPTLRHVTQAEAVTAANSITDGQVAPAVVVYGRAGVPSPPDPPTMCTEAPLSAATPTGEVVGLMEPVIRDTEAGFVGPSVYLFSSAAQQAATLVRFGAEAKACPRNRRGWWQVDVGTVPFTRVSAGSYRLGGWHGYLVVENGKLHGKVERAYDGYVGQGNALVQLRLAVPAQELSASAEKHLYTVLLRKLTDGLAGRMS